MQSLVPFNILHSHLLVLSTIPSVFFVLGNEKTQWEINDWDGYNVYLVGTRSNFNQLN